MESDYVELYAWNLFLEFSSPNRKILNELSSDSPAVPKIDEEKTEEEAPVSSAASASVPTSIYQTSSGQYSQYTHEQGHEQNRNQGQLTLPIKAHCVKV